MGKIVSIILAIKTMVEAVASVAALVATWLKDRAAKKAKEKFDQAHEAIKKAGEIKDAILRKKAKAKAVCDREKLTNPDSDCDAGNGDGPKL